mmetsp:Transcript_3872/g.16460  ORF Transcript_3872/g.16460 Transcript_3872/m.16460 type:complete len:204 (+) Transcript_3872:5999-6610(+)
MVMSSGMMYSRLRRRGVGPPIFFPTRSCFSKSSSCSRVSRAPCSFQQCFSSERRYLNALRSQNGQGTADLSAGAIGPPAMTFRYSSFIFSISLALQRTSRFTHASRRFSSSTSPSPSSSAAAASPVSSFFASSVTSPFAAEPFAGAASMGAAETVSAGTTVSSAVSGVASGSRVSASPLVSPFSFFVSFRVSSSSSVTLALGS